MNVDNNHSSFNYFSAQFWALEASGLSKRKRGIFYRIYSYCVAAHLVTYTICVFPEIIKMQDAIDKAIYDLVFAIASTMATIKIIILHKNWDVVVNIFNKLERGAFLPNFERGGVREFKWIRECVSNTSKWVIISLMQGFASIALCAAMPFIVNEEDQDLPLPFGKFPVWLGIENVYVKYIVQCVNFLIAVLVYMASDAAYNTFVAHICVQFKILGNYTRLIIPRSYKKMVQTTTFNHDTDKCKPNETPWVYLQKELSKIVSHHIEILQIRDEVEKIFHIINLTVYMGMCLFICCAMYQASLMKGLEFDILQILVILSTALFLMGVLSYTGNQVTLLSQSVADACWEIDFVGTDLRLQKTLILIIRRSQKPVVLTVGKFGAVSLMTLVGMLKMSFSYLMFLKSVNEL